MAESTLSIQYSELQREVARFAGWDRTPANWATDNTTDFGDILKAGLRQFYYPPALEPGQPRHEWSFLRPVGSISAVNGTYAYDLADAFAGVIIDDSVAFASGTNQYRLAKISESELRALKSKATATGVPQYYAVRAKSHAPTTGLRYEMLLYPTPGASYTIEFRYVAAPDTIDSTNKYPLGGAIHSETILESVLACAEKILDDDAEGAHAKRFMQCLAASIRADKEHAMVPKELSQ